MIFAGSAGLVLNGSKTQTRRLNRGHYREGGVYAVQPGRGKPAIAHIRITGIWQRPLGRITDIEAQAEGFETREDFFETFARVNRLPLEWPLLEPLSVWVFEFELEGK